MQRDATSVIARRVNLKYDFFDTSMVASWLSVASSIGMAVGPPLVYADQTVSIVRKKYACPELNFSQPVTNGTVGTQQASREMSVACCTGPSLSKRTPLID